MLEDREQEVNKREAKMQSFLGSSIGKKAMQEYVGEAQNAGVRVGQKRPLLRRKERANSSRIKKAITLFA